MSEIANITLVNDNEVFLVQRAQRDALDQAGKWASAGGSIDPDERPETAALREFSEELGIDLQELGISEENLVKIPSRNDGANVIHSFAVQLTEQQRSKIQPNLNWENSDARWISTDDLPKVSDIHPDYVQSLNLITRWFIDDQYIGVGNRAGFDYDDATYSAREQSDARLIFDQNLAYQHWEREFANAIIPDIEAARDQLSLLEQEKTELLKAFDEDKARADILFEKLDKIPLHKNHQETASNLGAYFKNDGNSLSYAISSVLGGNEEGLVNTLARGRSRKFLAEAGPLIEELKALETKYDTQFLDGSYGDDQSYLYGLKNSYDQKTSVVLNNLAASSKQTQLSAITDKNYHNFSLFFDMSNPLQSVEGVLSHHQDKANSVLSGDKIANRYLPHASSHLAHLTEGLAEELGEPYASALKEAANNSEQFSFATEEQRRAQLNAERVEAYSENTIAKDVDIMPKPNKGMTRVYHSSSRLYDTPSEEYITRQRGIGEYTGRYDSRTTNAGAIEDGMGYYTTDNYLEAIRYAGGMSMNGEIEGLINGHHTYAYDITLQVGENFIEVNDRRYYDGLPDTMRENLDAVLTERYGKTLANIESDTGDVLQFSGKINERGPLFAYGLDNQEVLDVLKEAGISAKRGLNGEDVVLVFDIGKLEHVSRIELMKAPPAIEALQKIYPDEAEQIKTLSDADLADKYFDTVVRYNSGVITDYHEDKLLTSLVETKGLALSDAQDVVNDAKSRIADFEYHKVYQGYEKPAQYAMDRPYVLQAQTSHITTQNIADTSTAIEGPSQASNLPLDNAQRSNTVTTELDRVSYQSNLVIPSDAEISRMVGGIPVMSISPEDLPHFKPNTNDTSSSAEKAERFEALYDTWLKFRPDVVLNSNKIEDTVDYVSAQRSAQVTTFSTDGRVNFFSILKPSAILSTSQELSETARVSNEIVSNPIPKADMDYISVYHEIGHMNARANGIEFATPYDDEFNADRFGLEKYLDAGGSEQVVKDYISQRALSGFTNQPNQYWVANALSDHFFSHGATEMDAEKAFLTNAELRLRITDITDGLGGLRDYSSKDIQAALGFFNQKKLHLVDDNYLRESIENLDIIRNDSESNYKTDIHAVIAAVEEVANSSDLDPQTQKTAQIVMYATERSMPAVAPTRGPSQYTIFGEDEKSPNNGTQINIEPNHTPKPTDFTAPDFSPSNAMPSASDIALATEHFDMAENINKMGLEDKGSFAKVIAGIDQQDATVLLQAFAGQQRSWIEASKANINPSFEIIQPLNSHTIDRSPLASLHISPLDAFAENKQNMFAPETKNVPNSPTSIISLIELPVEKSDGSVETKSYLIDPDFHNMAVQGNEANAEHRLMETELGKTIGRRLSVDGFIEVTPVIEAELGKAGFFDQGSRFNTSIVMAETMQGLSKAQTVSLQTRGQFVGSPTEGRRNVLDSAEDAYAYSKRAPEVAAKWQDSVALTKAARFSAGSSVGMSAFGLYSKSTNQLFRQHFKLGGQQASFARQSVNSDVAALGADALHFGTIRASKHVLDSLSDAARATKVAGTLGKFGKTLGPAGLVLSVVAGGYEYKAAKAGNMGFEAARAIGATGGGIVGGALGGAGTGAVAGIWLGPIGSGICGFGGLVVGGIAGAWAGGELSEEALGEKLQEAYDGETQAEIDRMVTDISNLLNEDSFIQLQASTELAQSLSLADRGKEFQLAIQGHGQLEIGDNRGIVLEASKALSGEIEQTKKLPTLSFDNRDDLEALEQVVSTLHSMEAMRTVPDGEMASEERRLENVNKLAETLNKIKLVQAVDHNNVTLRLSAYSLDDYKLESLQSLEVQTQARMRDKSILEDANTSLASFPIQEDNPAASKPGSKLNNAFSRAGMGDITSDAPEADNVKTWELPALKS